MQFPSEIRDSKNKYMLTHEQNRSAYCSQQLAAIMLSFMPCWCRLVGILYSVSQISSIWWIFVYILSIYVPVLKISMIPLSVNVVWGKDKAPENILFCFIMIDQIDDRQMIDIDQTDRLPSVSLQWIFCHLQTFNNRMTICYRIMNIYQNVLMECNSACGRSA